MDGWETRRKRIAGHDWCILKLAGNGGKVYGVEIDTAHFTGNQAPRVSLLAAHSKERQPSDEKMHLSSASEWDVLSAYTWIPGALRRLAEGGGQQGTGASTEVVAQVEEACKSLSWTEILTMTPLGPGYEETRMHYFIVPETQTKKFTYLRVNIFPDGGIARIRLWGYPIEEEQMKIFNKETTYELPSSQPYPHPEVSLCTNGGLGLHCSNKHYGVPQNLIQPSYGKDMGDGWETARHPLRPSIIVKDPTTDLVDSPLMDWAILKLGLGGIFGGEDGGISRIIIDTKHFRGNYPESVRLEGCYIDEADLLGEDSTRYERSSWFELIPRSRLGPDQEHVFDREFQQILNDRKDVTHIRVSIFPDGGLSRVRIYGKPRCPTRKLS